MIDNLPILRTFLSQSRISMEDAPFLAQSPVLLPENWDFARVEGMLLGLAIGDSLGNTTESKLPGDRKQLYGEVRDYLSNKYANERSVGVPSDDTQMSFWTLEQLLADGGLVPDHLARRLTQDQIFASGSTVMDFKRAYKDRGISWEEAGQKSAGNGALMRIAPILIPHLRQPSPGLWADAALAGMITHNDRASNACCVAFIHILWECLRLTGIPDPDWWVDTFVEAARQLEGDTSYASRSPASSYKGPLWQFVDREVHLALREDWTVLDACNRWYSGAYLLETMPCALYILARYANDPEEAMIRAVNDTKDNDTVAAITGAAVGALHGRSGLPPRWITGLLGRTGASDDWHIFELIEGAKQTFWQPNPALTHENIQAVLSYKAVFERPGFAPGVWVYQQGSFSYFDYNSEVLDFIRALGQNGFIQPFDWSHWVEGRQLIEQPQLLQKVGLQTLRKLLTLHVRADRFNEGHLASMFETGQIQAILRRLEDVQSVLP